MPELPEVEVVRRGLQAGVIGRTIATVEVRHPRAVRRQPGGTPEFVAGLEGRTLVAVDRRGKYLWLGLDSAAALTGHLGMSGQLLVVPAAKPLEPHLRVRFVFADAGRELRFVDQRTFGGLFVEPLIDDGDGGTVPVHVAHIARDPLDPAFDDQAFVNALRRRRTGIKRALLDQSLVSGVGNIYADESLWRARLHGARPTATLQRAEVKRLLAAIREVLAAALAAGGTSFDALYVSTEGVSGLFARDLAVYGRVGRACPRCGGAVQREPFMNRSSYSCPSCQPRPRPAPVPRPVAR